MRNNKALDAQTGIVRTDTDHTILRYRTFGSRDFQLLMDIEVKEYGAAPDAAQADILNFKHQLAMRRGKNKHGTSTVLTHKLKSRLSGKHVNVRYFGYHLLQFEKTNPLDSAWIKWNRQSVSEGQLTAILAFDRHPLQIDKPINDFLRDRHQLREIDRGGLFCSGAADRSAARDQGCGG
jgi:hypothetical protein